MADSQRRPSGPLASRVLVVDDERVNRELLSHILKGRGYDVVTAADGQDALDQLQATPDFDVVLLDVVMRNLGGMDCLREIRCRAETVELPVIMVTAEADRDTIVKAFRLGASDYLTKPIDPEVMLARVETHVQFHQSKLALRLSEERYMLAVNGSNAGIWDWDIEHEAIYFSPRWKGLLGYADEEFPASSDEWFRRIHPDDVMNFCAAIMTSKLSAESHLECELRMLHRSGSYRWMRCNGVVQCDGTGTIRRLAGSLVDVNDGKVHDPLTGLPNRLLMVERIEAGLRKTRSQGLGYLALLFIDLDNFKLINDSLGHPTGDELIVHVAHRLAACVRGNDDRGYRGQHNTVARFAGDEFTVLLDEVGSAEDAQLVAERIIAALSAPYLIHGQEVSVGVSIGISLTGQKCKSAEDLIREADTAMYYAKKNGRRQHRLFDPEMQLLASARVRLEQDLRKAVEAHDFSLRYQPIVRLSTHRIEGFEALIRWDRDGGEITGPGQFIPVAEELGLIGRLGEWVFREACRQAASWNRLMNSNPPIALSINCSPRELTHADFADKVRRAIADSEVNPAAIKIELTETALMSDRELIGPLLDALRAEGIRIGIDDFGTGYSSLAYLHRLPLDIIKIDRSFVSRMVTCRESREIVQTIITLAKSLNFDTVAEGIESEAELKMLTAMGCTHGQGYLFSRPLSAPQATRILEALREGALAQGAAPTFDQLQSVLPTPTPSAV